MQGRKLTDVMGKTSANMPGVWTSALMRIQVKSLPTGIITVFSLGKKTSATEFCKQYFRAYKSLIHNPKKQNWYDKQDSNR